MHVPLLQGTEFKINLETDHIELHGSTDESAGVLLRGSVVLDSHEAIKIRSIVLKFVGKVKVNWIEGFGRGPQQAMYKDEQTILEHEWSFLPHAKKLYHLTEKHYRWDFELPLPGDLPETVTHDLGQVYYRLKAVAERPTFSMNWSDKRTLTVSRLMLPTSLALLQQVEIVNTWSDKMSYEFSTPRKCFVPDSDIPITFKLMPIAPNLRFRAIHCSLKEYITLTADGHSKTFSQIIRQIKDEHLEGAACWTDHVFNKTETIHVPSTITDNKIALDTTNDLIKVRHKIKIEISLVNEDGHISELRAAIPVIISPVSSGDDDGNALPRYEDAWKSVPFDPDTFARMIAEGQYPASLVVATPNAAASLAPTSLDDNDASSHDHDGENDENDHEPAPLPWQGMDLSRVPSYTTAVRSNRLYSFSSTLPAYDSITIPGQARTAS